MNSNQLFIPKKIKVGFQKRSDTYTGNLGYVIYFDNKGVLRKETSWESWRSKNIDPIEFFNEPISGFVLNKKAGGTSGHSWEQRQTYSRVYDPRGFEFEITISNLLFILQECDCSKGKGLEGDFVYAWDGKDLVLLPASSDDFKKSIVYTNLQDEKVSSKDLKEGYIYMDSKQRQYVYLGKYCFNDIQYYRPDQTTIDDKKSFIFYPLGDDLKSDTFYYYHHVKSLTTIKKVVNDCVVDNFSTLLQNFLDSPYSSEYDHIEYLPLTDELYDYYIKREYGSLKVFHKDSPNSENKLEVTITSGCIIKVYDLKKGPYNYHYRSDNDVKYITPEQLKNDYVVEYAIYKNKSKVKLS